MLIWKESIQNSRCYVEKHVLSGLLIRSILRGKICTSASANELTDQHDMFCFNHASAFYTSNNIMKNVDEYRI